MNELLHFCAKYWTIILLIVIAVIILIVLAIKKKASINTWVTERKSDILKLWGITTARISSLMKKLFCDEDKILYGRIGVAVVMAVMLLIVLVSFFHGGPKFEISNGVIYVLGLILLILFSDSIKNLKIGDLIVLEREVKNKEKQVEHLSKENDKLYTQLNQAFATIHNSNTVSSSMTVNVGDNNMKDAKVAQADQSEQVTAEEDSVASAIPPIIPGKKVGFNPTIKYQFNRQIDQVLMQKYTKKFGLTSESVVDRVKFTKYLTETSPIMKNRAIFVGYAKLPNEEIFFDCPRIPVASSTYFRLYYMASMVIEYARLNKRNAKLVVLLPDCPLNCDAILELYQNPPNFREEQEKLEDIFAPAIASNYIEIQTIPIDKDECNTILKKVKDNYA